MICWGDKSSTAFTVKRPANAPKSAGVKEFQSKRFIFAGNQAVLNVDEAAAKTGPFIGIYGLVRKAGFAELDA